MSDGMDLAAAPPAPAPCHRLLVLNYYLPPDESVGGLRWSGLAKYLARQGWEVHVLTAAAGAAATAADGVRIYECPRLPTLNDAYRALADSQRRDDGVGVQTTEPPAAGRETLFQLARREIASLMSFPDESRGWMLRAAWRARRLVAQVRPAVVVTSGPPHSAHVAGALAVWGTGIPHVVDLRDPWARQSRPWLNHPIYGRRIARHAIVRMERGVLARARCIIANTEPLCADLQARYPQLNVSWIPNGVDLERLDPGPGTPFPGLSLAHVGTVYGGRDLGDVLRAFRLLITEGRVRPGDGSKIRLVGRIEPGHFRRLWGTVTELDLQDRVEVLGMLPRQEALSVLSRSTLALVLAQDQEFQVPGKLYEAIGLGRPTLVIAEPGGAAALEARRLGLDSVAPGAVPAIAEAMARLTGAARPSNGVVSYERLAGQMASVLIQSAQHGRP